jgi:predicted CxxxxCH...CXXCH cytochrome family protein
MRLRQLVFLASAVAAACLTGCDTSRSALEEQQAIASCTGCHGGTDNDTGAPPRDAHGQTTGPQVGAHTRHLLAGVACESCHEVPSSPSSPGHIGGEKVVFGAPAKQGGATPEFVAGATSAGGTCSGTYCHGATLGAGGALHAPTWNGGAAQAACGSCHALVPPSPHPQADEAGAPLATTGQCAQCHAGTVQANGALDVQGGLHVNGVVDTSVHGAGWVAAAGAVQPHGLAANFHDATWPEGIASCRGCHGQDLDGQTRATSCNACHAANAQAGWQTSCTFCHGEPGRAFPGAPPVNTRGQAAATERGVGAHQTHLLGKQISAGVACGECHAAQPYLDLGHVDGVRAVSLLRPGTTTVTGSFDDAAGTCASTYCHGNFRNGKVANAPSWTATAGQGACDTCHAPQAGADASGYTDAHQFHFGIVTLLDCSACHPPGYSPSAAQPTVNKTTHVDGTVEVNANLGWNPAARTCSAFCHYAGASPPWY